MFNKKEKPQPVSRDDALFEQLGKSKKRKKRKIVLTVISVLLVVAIAGVIGVSFLRRQVREQFASSAGEVQSYTASTGTISTVVSGSGTLANVDTETVTIPSGVEVTEILVGFNDKVSAGDLLATVDLASVRSAMSDLQTQIDALDQQISDAQTDEVDGKVTAGVSGRVKILYAQADSSVSDVMVEKGALAVLSLDGYMAVDISTDALAAGDNVTVIRADGTEVSGTVESVVNGIATVLVTDNGPAYGEEVTVNSADGTQVGTGNLYIHNPFAVTGYAGTVSKVHVAENDKVKASTKLFTLTDTGYTANYDSLLRSRAELEETMIKLLTIQRDGAVLAPISGSVYTAADLDSGEEITDLVTLSPDVRMSVTISVDETDILSLALGQEASVTVSSVSDSALRGIVTEIDKSGGESSGTYTAVVTLDKVDGMLSGMTASVDVMIEGVENAVLIPIEALHQTSDGAYVYTSYDEQTQEYGGRVDVVVGLSNNNYVEIKSGLSEGDTVYYTESQSIADMFSGMSGMGGFGGMGTMGGMGSEGGGSVMPGGDFSGEMPDFGGQMPSGGFGGEGGTRGNRGG